MEEIIRILMKRDKISRNEAMNLIEGCRDELNSMLSSGIINYDLATDCIADWLGLEPDYLEYFIS